MNYHDIRQVQAIHGYPSLSILLPTYRTVPENRNDPVRVKNLVTEAQNRLLQEFTARDIAPLLNRLQEVVAQIDYPHLQDGLAIFVNNDVSYLYDLPFQPVARVVVDETFATRDLVHALHYGERYWVLVLSEKPTRLFEGSGDNISETKGRGFPMTFEGPGGATRLPGGQGIESTTHSDTKHQQFFKEVDDAYKLVTIEDPLPLVVVGVDRYLAFFQNASTNNNVLATIKGNYDKASPSELAKLVWPLVHEKLGVQRQQVLDELEQAEHSRKCVSTIGEVWRMAKEGRGAMLVVEKGFVYPAHIDSTGTSISPASDATAPSVDDDAVDTIIETIMAKGGRVVFVDDGTLTKYQRIAMILRF